MRNAPADGEFKPASECRLKIYAFYRQATDADVTGRKPGMLNPVEYSKWQAWKDVEGKAR